MVKLLVWFMVLTEMAFVLSGKVVNADTLAKEVKASVEKAVDIRQNTQKNEEAWFQEKEKLKAEYIALEKEQKKLLEDGIKLLEQKSSLDKTIGELNLALRDVREITTGLDPFLKEVLLDIETLVENDPPMLKQERKKRVATLRSILHKQDVPISEKFRKTMETLFIEAQYGNTVEVYQENILLEKQTLLVDIFRLGRLSLFCKTPDGKVTGFYDPVTNLWQTLPASYNGEIIKGVEMGSKQRAMDFLTLPLGRVVTQ